MSNRRFKGDSEWLHRPALGAKHDRDRTTDRISLNVSRAELDELVSSVRTAMAFHFDNAQRQAADGDDLSAAYAAKSHDTCAKMLHWLQVVHDGVFTDEVYH